MHVTVAQLPEPPEGQDRVFTTDNAVIVMDGATAFEPVPGTVDTVTYVEHLGQAIAHRLTTDSVTDLREVVGDSIDRTRNDLALVVGRSPTATVSIARLGPGTLDLLVLGDSPIILGCIDGTAQVIVDDRIEQVAPELRAKYRRRLAAEACFDYEHRLLLAEIQQEQRAVRNTQSGFFIAEADPSAAAAAIAQSLSRDSIEWCLLLTDGAHGPLDAKGDVSWSSLTGLDSAALRLVLQDVHQWESLVDPCGANFPRAKRHDDKTVVSLTMSQCPRV